MTSWLTHPQECPHSSCSPLFWQRCEGPTLQPNTCGIITAQPETRLAKRPTHNRGKNNIRAVALEKSPAFMWEVTGGDEVALACLLLYDMLGGGGGCDRLRTVTRIVCLCYPPPSSALPPLHPVPHPTEDRVNSSLRSLHPAGTQSCTALYVSPGPAGERLKLQPLCSYDSLPAECGWRE